MYNWLQEIPRILLWEKFSEKYFITQSKLGKGVKSIEIVSSVPIVFAHLLYLANEISQISSILSSLIHFLTIPYFKHTQISIHEQGRFSSFRSMIPLSR